MNEVLVWSGTATAVSSVVHVGDAAGTLALLRRETVVLPDGTLVPVPLVSGNALRGRLRRVGEEMLREVLGYEGELTLSAAHALRSGGSLAKVSGEPLSGERLARVRRLVPLLAVFGGAGGGRVLDGCLTVSKLYPVVAETSHITGIPSTTSAFDLVQVEAFSRVDDQTALDLAEPGTAPDTVTMRYQVETFPAGTVFRLRLGLDHPTPVQAAFFAELLGRWAAGATVGGRVGTGHGRLRVDLSGPEPVGDWRGPVRAQRDDILDALGTL